MMTPPNRASFSLPRFISLIALAGIACLSSTARAEVKPPAGFTALFNGKDLTGWRGGDTFDHRKLLAMSEEK
ncbi:MAG TPA: DUF1080 domain-containing protein, partial [Verrucomicrobiae bacterium]|nr:DUF1080 domain-containing protein [Verrucomicrobiae bacterium]